MPCKTGKCYLHIYRMNDLFTQYKDFILDKTFPCVGAKAAVAADAIHVLQAGHLACPAHDKQILEHIYSFLTYFREAGPAYASCAIIFDADEHLTEEMFERFLWMRLQALHNMDAGNYGWDTRVANDPASAEFSFSLGSEGFYVVGLHPNSSRPARRFQQPALVFNPHSLFTSLRERGKYQPLQQAIRKRDILLAGDLNPMLRDHGTESEVLQYSGRHHENKMVCPLKIKETHEHYSHS